MKDYAEGRLVTVVRCAPGRFRSPGWFIEAYDEYKAGPKTMYRVVFTAADGKTVATQMGEKVGYQGDVGDNIESLKIEDVDGDGIDEIVEHWTSPNTPGGWKSPDAKGKTVFRIVGDSLQ